MRSDRFAAEVSSNGLGSFHRNFTNRLPEIELRESSKISRMSTDIEGHILKKYEIKKRLGKGVSCSLLFLKLTITSLMSSRACKFVCLCFVYLGLNFR